MTDSEFAQLAQDIIPLFLGTSLISVEIDRQLISEGKDGLCAKMMSGWTVIKIAPDLAQDRRLWVLLHETAHAKLHQPVLESLPDRGISRPKHLLEEEADAQASEWLAKAKKVAFEHFAKTGTTNPTDSERYRTILVGLTYI